MSNSCEDLEVTAEGNENVTTRYGRTSKQRDFFSYENQIGNNLLERFTDDQRGLDQPGSFLPTAEETKEKQLRKLGTKLYSKYILHGEWKKRCNRSLGWHSADPMFVAPSVNHWERGIEGQTQFTGYLALAKAYKKDKYAFQQLMRTSEKPTEENTPACIHIHNHNHNHNHNTSTRESTLVDCRKRKSCSDHPKKANNSISHPVQNFNQNHEEPERRATPIEVIEILDSSSDEEQDDEEQIERRPTVRMKEESPCRDGASKGDDGGVAAAERDPVNNAAVVSNQRDEQAVFRPHTPPAMDIDDDPCEDDFPGNATVTQIPDAAIGTEGHYFSKTASREKSTATQNHGCSSKLTNQADCKNYSREIENPPEITSSYDVHAASRVSSHKPIRQRIDSLEIFYNGSCCSGSGSGSGIERTKALEVSVFGKCTAAASLLCRIEVLESPVARLAAIEEEYFGEEGRGSTQQRLGLLESEILERASTDARLLDRIGTLESNVGLVLNDDAS